jgi:hypothetical protein
VAAGINTGGKTGAKVVPVYDLRLAKQKQAPSKEDNRATSFVNENDNGQRPHASTLGFFVSRQSKNPGAMP